MSGQHSNPLRVVMFNAEKARLLAGWSKTFGTWWNANILAQNRRKRRFALSS